VSFGALGCLAYGGEVAQAITLNMPKGSFSLVIKTCLCLGLYFTLPVMMFPVTRGIDDELLHRRRARAAAAAALRNTRLGRGGGGGGGGGEEGELSMAKAADGDSAAALEASIVGESNLFRAGLVFLECLVAVR
jgi:hypothetical protein